MNFGTLVSVEETFIEKLVLRVVEMQEYSTSFKL